MGKASPGPKWQSADVLDMGPSAIAALSYRQGDGQAATCEGRGGKWSMPIHLGISRCPLVVAELATSDRLERRFMCC